MTKKRNLSDLVREETQRQPEEPTLPQAAPPSPVASVPTQPEPETEESNIPKYLQLVRKEARLREDQIEQLTTLARKINRRRKGGERITENTLIRIAVDLLLSKQQELAGTTEAELYQTLGLEVPE
ncbi:MULTISPECIES: hypothetical protein [Nostocales]|uniref:Uncharacterized protein n=2 Tax=Nostocales TaxID=1161 RepID=A0ABW8WZQ8_9CYAN